MLHPSPTTKPHIYFKEEFILKGKADKEQNINSI